MALIARLLRRGQAPATPAAAVESDDEPHYHPIDARLIRRMLTWLRPYRGRYALGVGLGVAMVFLELLSPQFMKQLVNYCTGFVQAGAQRPPEAVAIRHVSGIVGVWALALAAALALQRAAILVMTAAGERVQFDLRRAIFAHLQRLSMSFYDRTKLGRIISRCTSDVNGLRDVNVWGIDTLVKNTLVLLVAGAMLLRTEPRLFAAVAWLAPVLYLCNRAFHRRMSVASQVGREGYTRMSTNLAENITGVRVVTAFHRQRRNLAAFDALQDENTRNWIRASWINGFYQMSLQLAGFAGRATIILYGGYLASVGAIEGVGSVVAAFLYWDLLMSPVLALGNFQNQLMVALAGAERIVDLLDTKPEVEDVPDARPMAQIRGDVRFEHVTFGYKPERMVLHDVNFEARAGQTVALVGATGSGKSSIISLLARFYQPQAGCVRVDGQDIRHVTGESLHRQMGIVLQQNFLFTGSVLDNIRYPRPEAGEQQVIDAAKAIGSYDAIVSLKDGFATAVGERGASLSLGQRQLVCFTRAFLTDPRILLLDEATSAVDSMTEATIQRSLERLLEGRTTFVVAHRLSTIKRADLILVLDHGRIIERGRHAELLRAGGRYAALYEQFVFDSMNRPDP